MQAGAASTAIRHQPGCPQRPTPRADAAGSCLVDAGGVKRPVFCRSYFLVSRLRRRYLLLRCGKEHASSAGWLLQAAWPRIAVGVGEASDGQTPYLVALLLAERLGVTPVGFPGTTRAPQPIPGRSPQTVHWALRGS